MEKNLVVQDAQLDLYHGQELSLKGLVHVFKIEVAACFNHIIPSALLSEEELNKASRFRHLQDQQNYLVGRYFLRMLLSRFLSVRPEELSYHFIANKKPAVTGLQFNISHTRDTVLIAISETAVGIDLEYINSDFDFRAISEAYFSMQENIFVQKGKNQTLNFYTLWTRKEALLKATGEGLVDELDKVPSMPSVVNRTEQDYRIESYKTTDQYMISLAFDPEIKYVRLWEYAIPLISV